MEMGKTIARFAAFLPVALLLAACTTGKMPVAAAPSTSALAISIEADSRTSLLNVESIQFDRVYFVRLADKKDELTKDSVLSSNFRYEPWLSGFQFGSLDYFLLGVDPGIYAAVGAMGVGTNTKVRIFSYFPEEMIRDSIVEVGPGEMAYMGRFTLSRTRSDPADPAQVFYYSKGIFAGENRFHNRVSITNIQSPQFQAPALKSHKKSRNAEVDFLKAHLSIFEGSDWADRITHSLKNR